MNLRTPTMFYWVSSGVSTILHISSWTFIWKRRGFKSNHHTTLHLTLIQNLLLAVSLATLQPSFHFTTNSAVSLSTDAAIPFPQAHPIIDEFAVKYEIIDGGILLRNNGDLRLIKDKGVDSKIAIIQSDLMAFFNV